MGQTGGSWTLLLFFLLGVNGEPESFEKHKLVRAVPKDKIQVAYLDNLLKTREDIDFWSYPSVPGQDVDLNLSPSILAEVKLLLDKENIPYSVVVESIGRLLQVERVSSSRAGGFDSRYHRLQEIHNELKTLAQANSDVASTFSLGWSYEGREQLAIKIGRDSKKPLFFFNCGIHAREWISPATCMYMIRQILNTRNSNADVQFMLNNYQWIILPVLNVDGYEYTHTNNRMWRKTRTPHHGEYGADPNRNFNYRFAGVGTSQRPSSDIYTGPKPFSEKVTQNVGKFLYNNRRRLKGYIDFHSYSQMWLSPWGYTSAYPPHYDKMKKAMTAAVNALQAVHGTRYVYGPAAITIYPTTGDTTDWTFGVLGVIHSYCVELRPRSSSQGGFILPANQIIPTGQETFAGLKALVRNM